MAEAALNNVSQIKPHLKVVERRVADTDDGFIMLAMELYEELIGANLTRNQAKVAHAVCRKTYGFKKKMDRIADSQLAELCRISRPKANIAKNELIAMRVLLKDGSKIGPNKNISDWQIPTCSQIDNIVTKSGTLNVPKPVTSGVTKTEHTKDIIQNIKEKEPTIPPKGGCGDGSLREELIRLVEGKFDFDKANTLHDAVEAEIVAAGYECVREFRVADRGDGRPGRIDLLVSNSDGDVCGIEIDRINVRDKSAIKLKQVADGFILVREGIVSDRYELYGVPVISAHPLTSACNGITRNEALEKAKSALEYYNSMSEGQCRDVKPFMTLLTPTQSRDSYTLEEINLVTRWVLSTWKRRTDSVPKPNNICRVNRFDGYLSDAFKWQQSLVEIDCQSVIDAYNEVTDGRMPPAELYRDREIAIRELVTVLAKKNVDGFRNYFKAFMGSARDFYFGGPDGSGWCANFDTLMKPETLRKVKEGSL